MYFEDVARVLKKDAFFLQTTWVTRLYTVNSSEQYYTSSTLCGKSYLSPYLIGPYVVITDSL